MRLVTFQFIDRQPRVGVIIGDIMCRSGGCCAVVFKDPPPHWSLLDVLEGMPEGMELDGVAEMITTVIDQVGESDGEILPASPYGSLTIGGVEMLIPLVEVVYRRPCHILRAADHVREAGRYASGAIVGSALINVIEQSFPGDYVARAAGFVRSLRS